MSESAAAAAAAPAPLLAPLLVAAYIACVLGAGLLSNFSLLAALHKFSTNGLFYLLLQLAIADIVLGATTSLEIWTENGSNWIFGNTSCVAYRGLSVFASTASSYLIATMALHSLATFKLQQKLLRRVRINDQNEDEEVRSSRHSLVASDASTPPRNMNVEYRHSNARISVTQPTIFVWVLAMSLSVPDFALSAAVRPSNVVAICTIVDTSQRLYFYSVLALFNLFVPMSIMCIAGVMIIFKLNSTRVKTLTERCDSIPALKLSLCLIAVYFIVFVPRLTFVTYNVYSATIKGEPSFIESLGSDGTSIIVGLALSCIYLSCIVIRPLLCIIFIPHARKAFTYGHRVTDV